jgi:hypothetical protein
MESRSGGEIYPEQVPSQGYGVLKAVLRVCWEVKISSSVQVPK